MNKHVYFEFVRSRRFVQKATESGEMKGEDVGDRWRQLMEAGVAVPG